MFGFFTKAKECKPRTMEETPEHDDSLAKESDVKSPHTSVLEDDARDNQEMVVMTEDINLHFKPESVGSLANETLVMNPVVMTERLTPEISTARWFLSLKDTPDNTVSWPGVLQKAVPAALKKTLAQRQAHRMTLKATETVLDATSRRQKRLENLVVKCQHHHTQVQHVVLTLRDVKVCRQAHLVTSLHAKWAAATERHNNILDVVRFKAAGCSQAQVMLSQGEPPAQASSVQTRKHRMETATRNRSNLLQAVSYRAAQQSSYARLVASAVTSVTSDLAQELAAHTSERLSRAAARRQIHLDRIRLSCGRHANYVDSVVLSRHYMHTRTSHMNTHAMDAATFRRDVKLEEIKSSARAANLSVHFRSSCAHRLFDAKTLNTALKTSAAQTSATCRRDSQLEGVLRRLDQASGRRERVRALQATLTRQFIASQSAYTDAKMRSAAYRRELILHERVTMIQERAMVIRGRKAAYTTSTRMVQRVRLTQRLDAAFLRRHMGLEARRVSCATKNWHARMLADQQGERLAQQSAVTLASCHDRLTAASLRREQITYPIFAKLVSLRGVRAAQVVRQRQTCVRDLYLRREAVETLRLAARDQLVRSNIEARHTRASQVTQTRDFMSNFYAQVIANTTRAKQRGAELRWALMQDTIIATAAKTVDRSSATVKRVLQYRRVARQASDRNVTRATLRREEALETTMGTALYFTGKVMRARHVLRQHMQVQAFELDEALKRADLRRANRYTRWNQRGAARVARCHMNQRARQDCRDAIEGKNIVRRAKAEANRVAALSRIQAKAQISNNRVTIAQLEKKTERLVDAALQTALTKSMGHNAESRRSERMKAVTARAHSQVSHAKGVATYQKEWYAIKAEVTRETAKLRVLETTKRRDVLMSSRKMGESTLPQLQPYAGLMVVGKAILTPSSA